MISTQPLYYQHPVITEFSAVVVSCAKTQAGFAVSLSQTAFYPEGGGQPADTGTLNGLAVLDVQEENGIVLHTLATPLSVGETVQGCIDAARRADLTRQHSGEHILSGLLHGMYGVDNVGFHISADVLTMDLSAPLTAEQLLCAEAAANEIVWANLPIEAVWHTGEELQHLTYRSKKPLEGAVRLVTVPGADCCACCGTHVLRTGEIGMIKLINWQKYKAGVRLFVVCGGRALADYEQKRAECAAVGQLLSAKGGTLAEAVKRQTAELETAKFRAVQLENRLFAQLAANIDPTKPAVVLLEDAAPDALRRMTALLGEKTQLLCAALCQSEAGLHYALACTAPDADLRSLAQRLNASFGGKGGGRPNFVQGSLQLADDAAQTVLAFLQAEAE